MHDVPAEVPASVVPAVYRSRIASQMGDPPMWLVILTWSPPVKNTT